MKSVIFFGVIYLLLLPVLALSCDRQNTETPVPTVTPVVTPAPTTVPALHGGEEAQIIDMALNDFPEGQTVVKDITLVKPGSLIVRLESNASTGYEWTEAEISDTAVVSQSSRESVGPATPMPGSSGTAVWVFDSLKAGTSTIKFSYGRPWEGGEKDTFALTINVTVQ